MVETDLDIETIEQSRMEVIDSLCSTIQRQSATCWELVVRAVQLEREQCAMLAEQEAQADEPGSRAAHRIAERIRARDEKNSVASAHASAAGRMLD